MSKLRPLDCISVNIVRLPHVRFCDPVTGDRTKPRLIVFLDVATGHPIFAGGWPSGFDTEESVFMGFLNRGMDRVFPKKHIRMVADPGLESFVPIVDDINFAYSDLPDFSLEICVTPEKHPVGKAFVRRAESLRGDLTKKPERSLDSFFGEHIPELARHPDGEEKERAPEKIFSQWRIRNIERGGSILMPEHIIVNCISGSPLPARLGRLTELFSESDDEDTVRLAVRLMEALLSEA